MRVNPLKIENNEKNINLIIAAIFDNIGKIILNQDLHI